MDVNCIMASHVSQMFTCFLVSCQDCSMSSAGKNHPQWLDVLIFHSISCEKF